MDANRNINFNIRAYDKLYNKYEKIHTEIFNPIEQARLHTKLREAIAFIKTGSHLKRALDYGCGTGNVTGYLIDFGFYVVGGDTSDKCLLYARKKYEDTKMLEILELNGRSLSSVKNNSLDLAIAYSVLHHVPDYLGIIKEMIRVVKIGGVICFDHEYNGAYWDKSEDYKEFIRLATPKKKIKRFFKLSNYIINIHKMLNPRYHTEGDIHLWPDDHIEWDKIRGLLIANRCEIVLEEDYLLYDSKYPLDVYNKYKDKCSDMHLLVARKM